MARRGPLPKESLHWVRYIDVLKDLVPRYGIGRLAVEKLDDAFEARAIGGKLEGRAGPDRVDLATTGLLTRHSTEIIKRKVRIVVVVPIYLGSGNLADDWESEIEISLDEESREGELLLWKPDVRKYFGLEPPPPKPVQPPPLVTTPKTRELVRWRGFKKEWVQLTVIALKLHLKHPQEMRDAIAGLLEQYLIDNDVDPPSHSKLFELVDWVFIFDDRPLARSSGEERGPGAPVPKQKGK